MKYGRPGWAALYKASNKGNNGAYDVKNLISLAKVKLMGGYDVTQWPPKSKRGNELVAVGDELLETFRIALLSRRALVRIGMMSQLARNMVASCMGICLGVSDKLESMLVDSLSEPILSEASARIINEYCLWHELLEALLVAMRYGAVETGRLGELAAWILFAIGWDAACRAKDTSMFPTYTRADVTLQDLLSALLGSVPEVELQRPLKSMKTRQSTDVYTEDKEKAYVEELLQRRVCFTHVIQLQKNGLSMPNLKMTASRAAMAACPPGTDAIDGFIPLYPPQQSAQNPPRQEAAELWVAQIQVRNKKELRPGEVKRTFKNMADVAGDVNAGLLGIDILLRFGAKDSTCKLFKKSGSNRVCLLLSTDSKLSLFKMALEAVSKSLSQAECLSSAFQRIVDAERSAFFKSETWSASSEEMHASRPKYDNLGMQMDSLTDVFLLENRTH
jgi:hypothetical protein